MRDFIINNQKVNLVKNAERAHTDSYQEILKNKQFSLSEVKKSIELAIDLQKMKSL